MLPADIPPFGRSLAICLALAAGADRSQRLAVLGAVFCRSGSHGGNGFGPESTLDFFGSVSTAIGAAIAVPWHRFCYLERTRALQTVFRSTHGGDPILSRRLPPWHFPSHQLCSRHSLFRKIRALRVRQLDFLRAAGFLMATIAAVMVINRLSLILPAAALDHAGVGWSKAWHMTRGNTWRLFWLSLLVLTPIFLSIIIGFALFPMSSRC